MTTMRAIGVTLVFIVLMVPAEAEQPAEPFEGGIRYWERPPEEELEPLPSLDPPEREELRERLEVILRLYRAKIWELRAEYYGSTPEEVARRLHFGEMDRLPDWSKVTRTIRAPLRPEHDPWVVETALELVQEDPIDWKALQTVMQILNRTETGPDPAREELARRILAEPIHPDQPNERRFAAGNAIFYFVRQWPEDAPEILAVICTLPHQPRERAILPVARDARRPTQEEHLLALRVPRGLHGREPSKAAAVLERIEASLEAGEYTLDEEGEERIERLREHARKGVWWRRLIPW